MSLYCLLCNIFSNPAYGIYFGHFFHVVLGKSEHSAQNMIDELAAKISKIQKMEAEFSSSEGRRGSATKKKSIFHIHRQKAKKPSQKMKDDVKKLQIKTIEAMGHHQDLCRSASAHQKHYLENEMPSVLTQMQSIEEMRVETFRKQLLSYSKILEQFSDDYMKVAADVNHFGNAIHKDEDIRNFVNNLHNNDSKGVWKLRVHICFDFVCFAFLCAFMCL